MLVLYIHVFPVSWCIYWVAYILFPHEFWSLIFWNNAFPFNWLLESSFYVPIKLLNHAKRHLRCDCTDKTTKRVSSRLSPTASKLSRMATAMSKKLCEICLFVSYIYGRAFNCWFEMRWRNSNRPWLNYTYRCRRAWQPYKRTYWTSWIIWWRKLRGWTVLSICRKLLLKIVWRSDSIRYCRLNWIRCGINWTHRPKFWYRIWRCCAV